MVVEQLVAPPGALGEPVHDVSRRCPGRRRRTGCRPRAPGRRCRGSAPCRAGPAGRGSGARRGGRRSSPRRSARAGRRRSAGGSWPPRARCGSRRRSAGTAPATRGVAAWLTSAKSCTSCTEPAASRAKPVCRAAMTSEWSPKMDSACVARVRAATCRVNGVSSPAILYMLGIISSRPCEAVKVVDSDAGLQRSVDRAGGTALGLHLDHLRHLAPQIGLLFHRPRVRQLAHRRGRRDRVDGDDLVGSVGDRGRGLVAVHRDRGCVWHGSVPPPQRQTIAGHTAATPPPRSGIMHRSLIAARHPQGWVSSRSSRRTCAGAARAPAAASGR